MPVTNLPVARGNICRRWRCAREPQRHFHLPRQSHH